MSEQIIKIKVDSQSMECYEDGTLLNSYLISTAKNGVGEKLGSECTPRGWHAIYSKIGMDNEINSVFVARKWTGEIYNEELANKFPDRDWILTRILQLEGLEEGFNLGGDLDSLSRYIYIHGTPDTTILGKPGSHGCIRMSNKDIIQLFNWVRVGTKVHIVA